MQMNKKQDSKIHIFNDHNSQGKIFRKTQDELIEDDWMKFKQLNMRKEDSFQNDTDNANSNKHSHDLTRNGETVKFSFLRPSQDISQNPSNIASFSKYYEEIPSQKNILSQEELVISPNTRDQYDEKQNTQQLNSPSKFGSNQQLQQANQSAGILRKKNVKVTQYNKPSLHLIGSTSAAEGHHHSSTGNIRMLNQKNFNRIMNIRKRIQNYINYYTTFGRKTFLLNNEVRKAINDKSDGGGDKDDRSGCLGLYRLIGQIKRYKCFRFLKSLKFEPINPYSTLHLIWLVYINIYNYLFFLALSFIIIFSAGMNNEDVENYYFGFTSCQWAIEILLKLNTAVYFKTKYINKRSDIIKLYLKRRFIYDIVPFALILIRSTYLSHIAYILFRIPLFLKLVNSIREYRDTEKQLLMNLKHFYVVQLINLVINLFLVGHFIACLWYIMFLIQRDIINDDQSSWFHEGIGSDGVWWKIYLQAFYWSFTLMATGSNEAHTTLEIFFTSVIMLFTTIVFGYMVNIIGVILSEMNKLEEDQRKDINLINKYMKRKQISKKLQHRINLDLEQFYLRSTKNKSEEESSVLTKISPDLTEEIKLEYNKNILSKIKYLSENFSLETIDRLCLSAEEVFYSPNQIIFQEKESTEPSLMVIVSGQVELIKGEINVVEKSNEDHDENNTTIQIIKKKSNMVTYIKRKRQNSDKQIIIQTLKKGSTLGEINFFTGCFKEYTAKSKTFTTILKIERNTFISIIENSCKDFEKFCEIRDKLIFYSDFKVMNKKCKLCQSHSHLESHCRQVHLDKNSPFFYSRICLKVLQERDDQFKRRINKTGDPFLMNITILNCIDTLRQQYDLNEEIKKRTQIEGRASHTQLMSVSFEIEDEDFNKQNQEDEEIQYDQENYSPKISPGFQRDESIMITSAQGRGYSGNGNQACCGNQQLQMIPEENCILKSTDQNSESQMHQNVNSLLNYSYGNNNVPESFPQRKQSLRYPSNGYLANSISQPNNNVYNTQTSNRDDFQKDVNQ